MQPNGQTQLSGDRRLPGRVRSSSHSIAADSPFDLQVSGDAALAASASPTARSSTRLLDHRYSTDVRLGAISAGKQFIDLTDPPQEVAAMTKKARDVMTPNAECVGENETLLDAAKKMADRGFGAMPICGEDNRLKGVLTDRDIVVKALAKGKDPSSTRAGELGEGKPVTIGADDSLQEALKTMARYKVRRLPVIDGHDLVGIIAVADIARELDDDDSKGDLIEAISEGPS
jgi:CBS domain-containing protein